MQKKEFEELVEARTVPELHPYIPTALKIYNKEHHDKLWYEKYEVSNVIEIVGILADSALRLGKKGLAKQESEQGEVSVKPTVTSEFLSNLITPWIQDIRQEIFNTRVPPFTTYKPAFKWLEEGKVDWDFLFNESVRKERSEAPKWMKSSLYYPYVVKEYPSHYSPYTLCFFKAKEVEKVTGFGYISVMLHIIADIPLTLNKVDTEAREKTHQLPSGDKLINRFVTVQIRGELSFDELRHLYQQIRQDLGVKRSKALKEKHLKLYQVVRRKGGAPKGKGTVAFWESVRQEINVWLKNNSIDNQYTTWKGVKRAYDLFYDKLRSQYLVEGGKRR